MIRKLSICLTGLFIVIACNACKAGAPYSLAGYLNRVAIESGIGQNETIEENFDDLLSWGIVDSEDRTRLKERLDYAYLVKTITRLINETENISILKSKGWIDTACSPDGIPTTDIADAVIAKAVRQINEPEFENSIEAVYQKAVKIPGDELNTGDILLEDETYWIITGIGEEEYEKREAEFDEVFSKLDVQGSFEIDLSQAEIIPAYEDSNTAYVNDSYRLLASKKNSFSTDGFNVTYSVSSNAIDVRISKEISGMNIHADLSVYDIQPSFRWLYEKDDLKNCFFAVRMNATEELGVSTDRYGDYYLKFRDLDSSSFKTLLDSMIDPYSDQIEASIPVCTIRTPVPQIPLVYLKIRILVNLYASGRAELVMYNSHNMGFETRDGKIRYINEHDNDIDANVQASAKAGMGINAALDAANCTLADIELQGGIKARMSSTLHLYDDEGDYESYGSMIAYSTLQELAKENSNVKVCGDLSLYWYLDLLINTAKTKMGKLGFSRSLQILNEDDQVFGNLHHIENGHFVEKCTRKKKTSIKEMSEVISDRIVLDSYAEVLDPGETYQIIVKGLPEGYAVNDLQYVSEDPAIASVNGGNITPVSPGSVKIKVMTSDGKYTAYVNILVSTG